MAPEAAHEGARQLGLRLRVGVVLGVVRVRRRSEVHRTAKGGLEQEVRCDSHRPAELLQQRVGVDLLDRHLVALAPGDGDAGIEVVDLGRPEGDGLQALLVLHLHLDPLPLRRLLLAALLQNGELLLVPGARCPLQIADGVVDLADLLLELGDLLRQTLDLVAVRLGHRPLVVAQDRHLRTRKSRISARRSGSRTCLLASS